MRVVLKRTVVITLSEPLLLEIRRTSYLYFTRSKDLL